MLPVYDAIGFNKVIEHGGRTKPWLLWVQANQTIKPYVVKVFTPDQIERYNSVESEVLGNKIGSLFDLSVPPSALINFPNSFINGLTDEQRILLEQKDDRIKFGTELIVDHLPFSISMPKSTIEQKIELDTLFAFDNLIRNRDRTELKPNILLKDSDAFLIDHEFAFERVRDGINEIKEYNYTLNWEYHICYHYLKKAMKKTKDGYFHTFEEYLRYININQLDVYFTQLNSFGYVCRVDIIKDYLNYVRNNSANFVNILKALIS